MLVNVPVRLVVNDYVGQPVARYVAQFLFNVFNFCDILWQFLFSSKLSLAETLGFWPVYNSYHVRFVATLGSCEEPRRLKCAHLDHRSQSVVHVLHHGTSNKLNGAVPHYCSPQFEVYGVEADTAAILELNSDWTS